MVGIHDFEKIVHFPRESVGQPSFWASFFFTSRGMRPTRIDRKIQVRFLFSHLWQLTLQHQRHLEKLMSYD